MNEQEDSSIYDINKWGYFLLLCLVTFLLLLVKKLFIENETTAFQILDQRGEMGLFHTISALQYFTIPVIYLYKFTIIAFVVWIGCFMFGYKVTFGQAWHVALVSESIFLVAELCKIVWFLFFETDPILFDIQSFYPLSVMNLVDPYDLGKQYFYPLKALNIFEVIYWFLLVYGINKMARKQKSIGYAIVFSSYVFLFMLWLGFYIMIYK